VEVQLSSSWHADVIWYWFEGPYVTRATSIFLLGLTVGNPCEPTRSISRSRETPDLVKRLDPRVSRADRDKSIVAVVNIFRVQLAVGIVEIPGEGSGYVECCDLVRSLDCETPQLASEYKDIDSDTVHIVEISWL
jgi:hypothetical protein